VAPFILRGVTLAGIDSVMAPMHLREEAWARLATDLDPRSLDVITTEIPLTQAVATAQELMSGQLRGRIVVKIH
jgi:acrylyl-CoA reductase (NADPH)